MSPLIGSGQRGALVKEGGRRMRIVKKALGIRKFLMKPLVRREVATAVPSVLDQKD